jgi:ribulose-5-phosphate 4-epimerase/fuculose-1-phosphate aldolase
MNDLRNKVALGCRIVAQQGLAREIAGHVSARIPDSEDMWIRCRGDYERGVRSTQEVEIRSVSFEGRGDIGEEFELPLELPIHGEIYRARPDVNAVVHAHPTYAVLCGVAGVPLRPVYGAYDMAGLRLARSGIPVYPLSRLINNPETARDLVVALGDSDACLMRGHGITTVGRSVEEAVLNAIRLERLAFFTWQLTLTGQEIAALDDSDFEFFDTPRKKNVTHDTEWRWDTYVVEDEAEQSIRNVNLPV